MRKCFSILITDGVVRVGYYVQCQQNLVMSHARLCICSEVTCAACLAECVDTSCYINRDIMKELLDNAECLTERVAYLEIPSESETHGDFKVALWNGYSPGLAPVAHARRTSNLGPIRRGSGLLQTWYFHIPPCMYRTTSSVFL